MRVTELLAKKGFSFDFDSSKVVHEKFETKWSKALNPVSTIWLHEHSALLTYN